MITNIAIFTLTFGVMILAISVLALQRRVDELEKRQSGKPWFK